MYYSCSVIKTTHILYFITTNLFCSTFHNYLLSTDLITRWTVVASRYVILNKKNKEFGTLYLLAGDKKKNNVLSYDMQWVRSSAEGQCYVRCIMHTFGSPQITTQCRKYTIYIDYEIMIIISITLHIERTVLRCSSIYNKYILLLIHAENQLASG